MLDDSSLTNQVTSADQELAQAEDAPKRDRPGANSRRHTVSPIRGDGLVRQRSRREIGTTRATSNGAKPRYSRKQRLKDEDLTGTNREDHEFKRPQLPPRSRSGEIKGTRKTLDGRPLSRARTGPTRRSPTRWHGMTEEDRTSQSPKAGSSTDASAKQLLRHSLHSHSTSKRVLRQSPTRRNTVTQAA